MRRRTAGKNAWHQLYNLFIHENGALWYNSGAAGERTADKCGKDGAGGDDFL